jgi:methionyl aminopeptidase
VIIRKSKRDIEKMAAAGEVVAEVLERIGELIAPGVTTEELDTVAEDLIRRRGGVPTFKGYRGFPASICASPNSMVVHGIPGSYRLEEGGIISIDVGVTKGGFVADSAYTFAVGEISPESQRLLDACQRALEAGIEQARPGRRISDISAAVQNATEDAGFSVVRTLVGHGVGRRMHEEPQIPNFVSRALGPELSVGMTLAIEPMITAGGPDVHLADDGWSIYTDDGSYAAHFEHTVAVTEDGPLVLTPSARLAANEPVGSVLR